MACASCEERARLLREARDAFNQGNMIEVERVLREVFGTVRLDISKLSAAIFQPTTMKLGERISLIKSIEAADPDQHKMGSGMLPDGHVHGPESTGDPKVS